MKTAIKSFGRENLLEKEKVKMCQNNKYLSHSHMNQMHGFVYLYFQKTFSVSLHILKFSVLRTPPSNLQQHFVSIVIPSSPKWLSIQGLQKRSDNSVSVSEHSKLTKEHSRAFKTYKRYQTILFRMILMGVQGKMIICRVFYLL